MRTQAKEDGRNVVMYINKFVAICGESWQFRISATADTVWTEANLFSFDYSQMPPVDRTIHYPKTRWGTCAHWDSELQEFLRREIGKRGM